MDPKTLPKAELHCRLEGILDPRMAWDIHRDDPMYPIHPGELERAYPVTDLQGFFRWRDFVRPIMDDLAYFYPILERHIARLKAQRVQYSEIMIAASEIPRVYSTRYDSVAAIEKVGAFRRWADRAGDGAR